MEIEFKLEGTITQIRQVDDEYKVAFNGDTCIKDANIWIADADGNYAILLPKKQEFVAKGVSYDLLGKKGIFYTKLKIKSWPKDGKSKIVIKLLDVLKIKEMVFTNEK